MTDRARIATVLTACLASLALSACGGGSIAVVGGAISGLGSGLSLVVQDNRADNLTLTANGSFSFATTLSSGSTYDVTVLQQPAGQDCTVANGTGTIDTNSDSVNTVVIACSTTSSLGGTVTGLLPGTSVTLSNEGGTALPVATNGAFAFPGLLAAGTAYDVTVTIEPAGQTCTVVNPTGLIVANAQSSVTVTCQ